MRYLLIVFIFIAGCTERPNSFIMNEPPINDTCYFETDTYYAAEYDDYFQWEFIGDWIQMTIQEQGKTGRWPKTIQPEDTARYRFYGHRIDVYTELASHHTGYQVIMDGVLVDTVITRSELTGEQIVTWSDECLPLGNHVLELVKFNIGDNGSFVINGAQIYFYVNPDLNGWDPCTVNCDSIGPCPPCEVDTIFIPADTVHIIDTVYMSLDTLVLQPKIYVVADSAILIKE